MFRRFVLLTLTALVLYLAGAAVLADDGSVGTGNWFQLGESARRQGMPIMLVFISDECPYCRRLKREVLVPLVESGKLKNRVLLKEFNIDRGGKIIDFDGERIRARLFVSRYQIYATPTVVMLNPDGEPLTAPIVGFNGPEAYSRYLEDAISSAVLTLATTSSPRYTYHQRSDRTWTSPDNAEH